MTKKDLNALLVDIIKSQNGAPSRFFEYKEEFEKISHNALNTQDRIYREFLYLEAGEEESRRVDESKNKEDKKIEPVEASKEENGKVFVSVSVFSDDIESSDSPANYPKIILSKPDGSPSILKIFPDVTTENIRNIETNLVYTPKVNQSNVKIRILNSDADDFKLVDKDGKDIKEIGDNEYIIQNNEPFKIESTGGKQKLDISEEDSQKWQNFLDKFKNDNNQILVKKIIAEFLMRDFLEASFKLLKSPTAKKKTYVDKQDIADILEKFKDTTFDNIAEIYVAIHKKDQGPIGTSQLAFLKEQFESIRNQTNTNEFIQYLKDPQIMNQNSFRNALNLCRNNAIRTERISVFEYLNKYLEAAHVELPNGLIDIASKPHGLEPILTMDQIFSNETVNKFWINDFFKEIIKPNAVKLDSLIEHLGTPNPGNKITLDADATKVKKPILQQNDAETILVRNELTMYSIIALILGFLHNYGAISRTFEKPEKGRVDYKDNEITEHVILTNFASTIYLEGILSATLSKTFDMSKNLLSKAGRMSLHSMDATTFISLSKQIFANNKPLIDQIIKDMNYTDHDDVILSKLENDLKSDNFNESSLVNKAIEMVNNKNVPQILNQLPKYFSQPLNTQPKTIPGKLVQTVGKAALKGKELYDATKPNIKAGAIVGRNVTNINDKEQNNV